MDYTKDPRLQPQPASPAARYDEGLRAFMLKIYNYMAGALALTGVTAYVTANTPLFNLVFGTPLMWVVMLAPLGIAMWLGARVMKMSTGAARAWFWAFAAIMGMSLASIFVAYTGASIARVFFITASVFGAMSLYGYSTKRSLAGMGSFMMMGLFGIIIASLVNVFMHSSGLQFAVSLIGVVVFVGLIAWDTQRLRQLYYQSGGGEMAEKIAIHGALSLYLNFINLFISLMNLMGDRR